jgi:predicted HTH transcriptional regulator
MPKLLTAEELKELSKGKVEPHLMSFKQELLLRTEGQKKDLAWHLAGLANAANYFNTPAYLIVGILDPDAKGAERIVSVTNPNPLLETISRVNQSRILDPVPFVHDAPLVDGKTVLVLVIEPTFGEAHRVTHRREVPIWRGNVVAEAAPDEVDRLRESSERIPEVAKLSRHASIQDFDQDQVISYLKRTGRGDLPFSEETLLRVGLMRDDRATRGYYPTLAGLLMFGKFPQEIPGLEFTTVSLACCEDERGERLMNPRVLKGSIVKILDQVEAYAWENHVHFLPLYTSQQMMESFLEALREAVTNALIHRSYQMRDREVIVRFYSDEVFIESPGNLPPPLTEATVETTPNPPRRNLPLVNFMFELKLMERLATGIHRMRKAMARYASLKGVGLQDDQQGLSFKVVLFTTHALSEQLNERQAEALGYMRIHGPLTVNEYLKKFGCGEKLARRELRELVQLKLIIAKQVGRTRIHEIGDF